LLFLGLPLAILVAGVWEIVVGVTSVDANPELRGVVPWSTTFPPACSFSA
jgi:hypothetical protein